jgi:hypothetical protein
VKSILRLLSSFSQQADIPITFVCNWGGGTIQDYLKPPRLPKGQGKIAAYFASNCENGGADLRTGNLLSSSCSHCSLPSYFPLFLTLTHSFTLFHTHDTLFSLSLFPPSHFPTHTLFRVCSRVDELSSGGFLWWLSSQQGSTRRIPTPSLRRPRKLYEMEDRDLEGLQVCTCIRE